MQEGRKGKTRLHRRMLLLLLFVAFVVVVVVVVLCSDALGVVKFPLGS
jgi:predicted nucleic acid-binding Zn ribbon protein